MELRSDQIYRNGAAEAGSGGVEVSVIYVNYNCADLLISSIRSFDAVGSSPEIEIIIVDNQSKAEDIELLRNFSSSATHRITLYCSPVNAGFAAANNIGAGLSIAPYLFFLNPDTLLVNGAPGILHRFMKEAPGDIAACGANLLQENGTPNHAYGNFPGLLLELCNVGMGLSAVLGRIYRQKIAIGSAVDFKDIREVSYVVGANIFIRRSDFEAAGGFDESYFMYYEETDLFKRLKQLGKKACIVPEAEIVHLEGGSFAKGSKEEFSYRKFRIILESKLRYYRKWHPGQMGAVLALIRMQIRVQCLKGKWGRNSGKLLGILEEVEGRG